MVKFTLNGTVLALTEKPNWVHVLDNGCYGLCDRMVAEGVAINGTVYNLPGHSIGTAGEVTFEIIDAGTYIMQKDIETERMLTDLDIANIEAQQAITELELMILEG